MANIPEDCWPFLVIPALLATISCCSRTNRLQQTRQQTEGNLTLHYYTSTNLLLLQLLWNLLHYYLITAIPGYYITPFIIIALYYCSFTVLSPTERTSRVPSWSGDSGCAHCSILIPPLPSKFPWCKVTNNMTFMFPQTTAALGLL